MKNRKLVAQKLAASIAAAQAQNSPGQVPTMGQPVPAMGMMEPGQYSGNNPQEAVATTHRYDEQY